jgi:hypothetical protein
MMSKSTPLVRKPLAWSARAIAIVSISALSSGCSALNQNATCALIGTGVGAGVGFIAVAATDEHSTGDVFAGGAIGALVGAGIGYGVCLITGD